MQCAVNAAFAGLGQITGVMMPLFWSYAFAFFANVRASTPVLLRWGKGGFLVIAGAAWIAAYGVSRSLSASELVLEERQHRTK
jgi:hypothetical protein